MYTVGGFLMKNKDVDQAVLFEALASSSKPFCVDVCRFQDMLAFERKMQGQTVGGGSGDNSTSAGGLKRRQSVAGPGSKATMGKGKPTVSDTFRKQLQKLNDILDTTTPWYVRCIKPNSKKAVKQYDDELCTDQLNYSGMLDIIRIRREGFPVHVPFDVFVTKYAALATVMKKKLNKDDKKACAEILSFVKAPETEWQCGKTKIFLRNTVFEPLNDKLRILLEDKVILIQKTWKGLIARKKYKKTKMSVIKIQAAIAGATVRLEFMSKRRNAVVIQSWWRGCLAREFVKALKIKRKKELEKKKQEEKAKREKELRERGEQIMEESFLAAQKELFAMSRVAELKAQDVAKTHNGADAAKNLDRVFNMLADDKGTVHVKAQDKVASELDAMFADPNAQSPRTDGTRTIRRKKRVQKQMDVVEAGGGGQPQFAREAAAAPMEMGVAAADDDANFNPAEYSMIKYAEKYFNDHPKDGRGNSTLSRKGKNTEQKKLDDPMPKAEMIVYTKQSSLATSLTHMHNPENVNLACSMFKDLMQHLKGNLKEEHAKTSVQSIVAYCLERPELRDEVYCQLIRQTTNNPGPDEQLRGWHILCVCCVSFPPGKQLYKYLISHIKVHSRDKAVGHYATWALHSLKKVKLNGIRRIAPSQVEIDSVRQQQPIICRFYFLDGKAKAVGIQPSWTVGDVIIAIAEKMGLQKVAGWALFESNPASEHFIRNHEYIGDVLAEWELAKVSSMKMSKYQTTSRKGGATAALGGGGDAKFVFRKRLFLDPREISTDPVEYGLVYAQAVHCAVRADEFPTTEKVALQMAGLQAQVIWGDADDKMVSRYEDIGSYLPWRIQMEHPNRTKEQWVKALLKAHKEYGMGKSDMQAKVLYLTTVKQYPLYGGTFFDVQYKGFWPHPNRLLLCIDIDGFKFVNGKSKDVLESYDYSALRNIEVNAHEDTITFNLLNPTSEGSALFMFFCPRKDDVANLIASYSPEHRNWKQVGLGDQRSGKGLPKEDDKQRLLIELERAKAHLARSGMLLKPAESKGGFLATTLRRKNKPPSAAEDGNLEKIYDRRYWSYSKSKISQPLAVMSSDETSEAALKTFASLLIYAKLASEGGYEVAGDENDVMLIQNVIGRCLEKEDVCNEMYLQLLKQTTDQPDANSTINQKNWQFFCLLLGVVVPRNKLILNYIQCHLRICVLETSTEEALYAQFALTCLTRTLENKNRKYPPSSQEIMCAVRRAPIYSRFYFMDGEFRALMFDSAATTAEVVTMVKERIGLGPSVTGFSLFEVFGALERNMLPWEKVPDAIFKWEKYAKSTHSQKELHLTFKKRLFLGPFQIPATQVEFDLTFWQAVDDLRTDRFPVTVEEASQLAALRAQVELGDWDSRSNYDEVIEQYLPKHYRAVVDPLDIAEHHKKLKGKDAKTCNVLFLKFIMCWPLYGSTIFEVVQSYTSTLPKNLWLAVNESGIHIMRRRTREPLISYEYRSIVNYSPSLRNLMIVTESLTRGTKFVFNTSQASQIAHLIKDYTHIIIQKKVSPAEQASKRDSVISGGGDSEEIRGFNDVGDSTDAPAITKPLTRRGSGQYGFE